MSFARHHSMSLEPLIAFTCAPSPKGAPYHSEGLPSLGEATLDMRRVIGKQTQRTLHAPTSLAAFQRTSAAAIASAAPKSHVRLLNVP